MIELKNNKGIDNLNKNTSNKEYNPTNNKQNKEMYIDIHFHPDMYTNEELKKLDCKQVYCIANSVNKENHNKIIDFVETSKHSFLALGVYPEFASYEELKILEEVIEKKRKQVIALGEVGLDKTYNNFEQQIEVFKEIIKLSQKYELPLIIHTRKAEKEVIEILEELDSNRNQAKIKAILHYFSGKFKLAKRAQENGYFLTIPSNVQRVEHFQKFVNELELNKLLPETDSPFLHPLKEWPNYPINVKYAYEYVSTIKQINQKELEQIFANNFKALFNIELKRDH